MTRLVMTAALAASIVSACDGVPSPAERRPYVVTAIDYHFHDAHPSLPIRLDRALQFSNQGRNPHNVTIKGTDYDRRIRPGQRITIEPVSSLLPEPGRYPFVCRLHAERGMSGVLVLVSG